MHPNFADDGEAKFFATLWEKKMGSLYFQNTRKRIGKEWEKIEFFVQSAVRRQHFLPYFAVYGQHFS